VYNALDLYSKVEDLLGVNEVTPTLYEYYFKTLESLDFNSLLDIGCGRGAFLAQIRDRFPNIKLMGIDLSPLMVKSTREKSIDAKCIDICHLNKRFEIITAVFDMVNYLDDKSLIEFMRCVEESLEDGGYFICDINSLYGFKEIAVGSFIKDDSSRFVTIDSFFENNEYYSEFTLFEKVDSYFLKSQESITQYYHTLDRLQMVTNLKLIEQKSISIYSDEVEKFYLVFSTRSVNPRL
jgi:predicted TPR repeat methyltransferase